MAKNSNTKMFSKPISGIRMLKRQNVFLKRHLKELNQLKEKLNKLKQ